MYVLHVSLISPPLLPLAAQTSTNMKTMERQDTTGRGQMELPLGNSLGGRIAGRRTQTKRKAPEHVANWWFARMRLWSLDSEAKPEGRVAV